MRILAVVEGLLPIITLVGALMLTVPLVDAIYGENISTWFAVIGASCILAGYVPYKVLERLGKLVEMGFFESLLAYSLAWLVVPAISALALSMELPITYDNALFECISGFTGTGLTVLRGLDTVKRGLLFWRGLMQWTGELGVVVFTAVFLPFFWRFGFILYSLERPVRIAASLRETAAKVLYIYSLVTVIGIVVCIHLGVEPFDAVVHVMTAIATGGMSNYDANYEAVFEYASMSIYPITALMVLGGFNFAVLSLLLDGEFRRALSNEEFKAYLYLVFAFLVVSLVVALPYYGWSLRDSSLYGVFNAISALTTTGFSVGRVGLAESPLKMVYVVAMYIGSMSFSTAGGIKVVRLLVAYRKLGAYVVSSLTGGAVQVDVKLGETVLDEREVANALLYLVVHYFAILIGASVLKAVIPQVDMIDAVFEVTSAASNVGLSTGICGPEMPLVAKATLMCLMYIGRLEYLPLVALAGVLLYRKYRVFIVR